MSADHRQILIAGGGPVGLLCAWLIGRRGIPVRLFDNNSGPQADPRAATTHPATLDLLAEGGVADGNLAGDMARAGLVAPIFQFWDRPSGELVAQFDHAVLKNDSLRGAMRAVQDCEAHPRTLAQMSERRDPVRS